MIFSARVGDTVILRGSGSYSWLQREEFYPQLDSEFFWILHSKGYGSSVAEYIYDRDQ